MEKKKTSREYLELSALELLTEWPINKVTVEDIVQNCSISKRTFYNYFRDKNELVSQTYIHLLEKYFEQREISLSGFIRFFVQTSFENRQFLRNAIVYTEQNNICDSLYEPVGDQLFRASNVESKNSFSEREKLAATFVAYGMVAFLADTASHGYNYKPEEMISFFENGIPKVLKG